MGKIRHLPTSHEGTTRKPQARNRCGHGPVAPVQIAPQSQPQWTLIEPNYTENPTVQTHAKNHRPCANYERRGRCDWEARTWPRRGAIHVNTRTNSRPYVRTWKQTSSKHRRITSSELVLADIENPMQGHVTFVRIAGRDARPRRGGPRSGRPEVEAECKCKAEGGSHSFVMLSSRGRGDRDTQNATLNSSSPKLHQQIVPATRRKLSKRPHNRSMDHQLRRHTARRLLGVAARGAHRRSLHRKRVQTLGSVALRRTTPSCSTAKHLTDSVHRMWLSSTASTNVACEQQLETILSVCVAPLSDRPHEPAGP
jgi:hypothetical protein